MKLLRFAVGAMALAFAGIAAGPTAGSDGLLSRISILGEASLHRMEAGYEGTGGVRAATSIAYAGIGDSIPVVAMAWPGPGRAGGNDGIVEAAGTSRYAGGGSTSGGATTTTQPRSGNPTAPMFGGSGGAQTSLRNAGGRTPAVDGGAPPGSTQSSPASAVPSDKYVVGSERATGALDSDPAGPAFAGSAYPLPSPAGLTLANLAPSNPALVGAVLASSAVAGPAAADPGVSTPGVVGPAAVNAAAANLTVATSAVAEPAVAEPAVADATSAKAVSADPAPAAPISTAAAVANAAPSYPALTSPTPPADDWVIAGDPSNVGPTGPGARPSTLASLQSPTIEARLPDPADLHEMLVDGLVPLEGSGVAVLASSPTVVPEPGTIALFGIAAVALMTRRRRRCTAV